MVSVSVTVPPSHRRAAGVACHSIVRVASSADVVGTAVRLGANMPHGYHEPMPKRLPDELFRKTGVTESEGVGAGERHHRAPRGSTRVVPRARDAREFTPSMVVAGVVGALVIGFGVGKLVTLQPDSDAPVEPVVTSAASTPTLMPSPESTLAPWSGDVRTIPALEASGRCIGGMGDTADPPSNLVDDDAETQWRCAGPGVGETISFTLPPGEEVVGVRLVNGNTSSYDRYLAERRILSVKWEFSDKSWVVQPLAANDRQPQEFRFPPPPPRGRST